ncbi:hypothetical protein GQ43DRAFT_231701 [Delitschia confertaspora ATCC 74209]|uniref:GAR domain-containing protein n=1 Tax=Delitschia confertaspora ATCC 74209 TaxID=1513339 RepID=A0A9P4MY28_9PLEO|nr:hypothetical protein GQ43DRAFT_231701 [Delitschia confertaspora ATCC 74209]
MAGLSSPLRFLPPISPGRAASPTVMSPSRRIGRSPHGSEESHFRDLSPSTTLRAFTEQPIPFDTTDDEYKIFACINNLTHAEKDLGARVSKAAQRLKSWCMEIEEWGWSGSFEPPSEDYKETRRRSVQAHILEHIQDPKELENVGPMEYYGSLLSTDVEAHEARLDEIAEELPRLEFEELKDHVLTMHVHRSRPAASDYGAPPRDLQLMDDFSILVTQTVVSALPYHYQLITQLRTWRARLTILRVIPGYLEDLNTAKTAMRLGWEAIEPPSEEDFSSIVLDKWKEAVDTISDVLKGKIADLGQRMDNMLDLKEATEQLPDGWIDEVEGLEQDFGNWMVKSRQRIINIEVLRKLAFRERPPAQEKPDANLRDDGLGPEAERFGFSNNRDFDIPDDNGPDEGDGDDTILHNDTEEPPTVSSSFSSMAFVPQDSWDSATVTSTEDGQDLDALSARPRTPESPRESIYASSPESLFASSPPNTFEDSPSVRNSTNRQAKPPAPPLNSAMTKRRAGTISNDLAVDSTPPWPPSKFLNKLTPNTTDDLERKISDILTTIPTARIRLKSGTEPNAPEVKSTRSVTRISSQGYLRARPSINSLKSPELTLARANDHDRSSHPTSGRRSQFGAKGDNDIELYHITQPGTDKPHKLYIRRVGENGERVMVRVGGGWSDLREYLQSYAEHHGLRMSNESKFEVLGLEVRDTESPRPGSAAARPLSAAARRSRRSSGGNLQTTPKKSFVVGVMNAPPSTGSSRHSWTGNEVGLAGPKAKKLDLPKEKTEWIEGMMKQARTVSGTMTLGPRPDTANSGTDKSEPRSESRLSTKSKPEFVDLGKVGGTKRVFMKGGKTGEH